MGSHVIFLLSLFKTPRPPKIMAEVDPAEGIKDVVGNLAERDVKKKECGHQEEDPHETGFRLSLNPEPHSHESHREERRS